MAAEQPKNKNGAKKRKISDEFQEDAIFQAPEIIREPSSRQARLGSNVVLRITASGKPLPSFQWYHNGKKISGANTDRLTLSKVRRASAGAYHCEAKNHAGKAVSRQCMLSFFTQKIPKLVLNARELSIAEGKPITLKVATTDPAAFKDFRVFWVFNGMRIKGAHGLELSIAAGKKKYEGEYKAMISVGSGIETSNVCKVTIVPANAAQDAPVPSAPEAEALEQTNNWEDFLFNPEDENAPLENPVPEDGASEFNSREIQVSQQSPLALIERMKEEAAPEEDDNIIADWDAVPRFQAKAQKLQNVVPITKKPKLAKKKEFLENFLARWQKNMGRFGKAA